MTSGTLIAPPEQLAPSSSTPGETPTYSCPNCGHVLRVSGIGRHRVYFEPTDELLNDPVMNRVCPVCWHPLPGKNPA
jgi:hypothetical protein